MNSRDMQMIGLCRFSYPAYGGFQVEHDTIADRITFLYQKARLEERFRLMETVALPCLRAQTDQNFDLIIVIGDSLPNEHRDRLHDITADISQIQIVSEPPGPQRDVMKRLINQARKDPSKPCLQFRHDDDDAVAVDFVDRFRKSVDENASILEGQKTAAFDFDQGYIAEIGSGGVFCKPTQRKLYVASLGFWVRGGSKLTIMNFRHGRMDQHMPVVTHSDTPMWVRTHNGYNDSRQKTVKHVPVTPLTADQMTEFRTRFAIDTDHVRQVFG